MSKWIKKEAKVVVIAGNDKGVVGEVMARSKDKVIVKGVNVRKRHMKSRSQDRPSEIIQIERPIHISNVALADDDGKPMKVTSKKEGAKKDLVQVGKEEKVLRTLKK